MEDIYDDLPHHLKESAGLPFNFYNLNNDQQYFFERLREELKREYSGMRSGKRDILREELSALVAELENIVADI